jgi:hypothetical protein
MEDRLTERQLNRRFAQLDHVSWGCGGHIHGFGDGGTASIFPKKVARMGCVHRASCHGAWSGQCNHHHHTDEHLKSPHPASEQSVGRNGQGSQLRMQMQRQRKRIANGEADKARKPTHVANVVHLSLDASIAFACTWWKSLFLFQCSRATGRQAGLCGQNRDCITVLLPGYL